MSKRVTTQQLASRIDELIAVLEFIARADPPQAPQAPQVQANPPQATQANPPQATQAKPSQGKASQGKASQGKASQGEAQDKPLLRGTGKMAFTVKDGMVALHIDPLMNPQFMSEAVYRAFQGARYYVNIRRDGTRVPKGRAFRCTSFGVVDGATVHSAHAWYVIGLADDVDLADARLRAQKARSLAEEMAKAAESKAQAPAPAPAPAPAELF